jgi:hypothetical protein
MRLSPWVPESARTGGSRLGPPRRDGRTNGRSNPIRHKYLLAAATAAAIFSSGAAAQQPEHITSTCSASFTAAQFHRTVDRIYHQHGHVLPRQKARLLHMRQCAITTEADRAMRRMFVRQRHARQHRLELARMGCGSASCNRRLGRYLAVRRYGVAGWNCTYPILDQESGWNVHATNSSSGAYGIPQALPGGKMASAGSDWYSNPRTQIRWYFGYVDGRYGGPCGALSHKQATGWY